MWLARLIETSWYKRRHWLTPFLMPIACLYFIIYKSRRLLYSIGLFKTYHCHVPVIVIGNISVGGTGKTPCTIALINWFKTKGLQPGVVTRGYGAQVSIFPHLVTPSDMCSTVGDEPFMIFRQTGVPVCLSPNRPEAVRYLEALGVDVILSDDGLQHYAMGRNAEIVLIDSNRLLGNRWLLPAGPLRELPSRLETASLVVYTGDDKKYTPTISLVPQAFWPVSQAADSSKKTTDFFVGQTVYAVAGIGNPARFYSTLTMIGINVIPVSFPDHHPYTADDFRSLTEHPIIMTEKDAVKCAGFILNNAWYLAVTADLPEQLLVTLDEVVNG